MNYRVSSDSPTDELMTLGQILSEVGDYMSAILDRDHLSLSRRCATRLRKVVGELVARQRIESPDDLYEMPASAVAEEDLGAMTVSQLHALYRRWPMRHREKEAMGREHLTFFHEGRIVRELLTRKTADKSDRLKIDYCVATYGNELENLSFILSLPLKADGDNIYPDLTKDYSPEELASLIRKHSSFRDIIGREILVEYVDIALDLLERDNKQPTTENRKPTTENGQRKIENALGLLAELSELVRRKTIHIPAWVGRKLEELVNQALDSGADNDPELPLAVLALQMQNGDSSLTDKAAGMINRCYKRAFDESAGLEERIASLHTAVMCCDYVTRFSPLEAAACWNHLATLLLTPSPLTLDSSLLILQETAHELEDFAPVSSAAKDKLNQIWSHHSTKVLAIEPTR